MDFGDRNYNPDLGRWFSIDPLAELMRSQSPYNYGFNNPIYFSDYAGTIPWPMPEFFKNWVRKSTPDDTFRRRSRNRFHYGIDLNYSGGGNTDYGAPIVATHSGKVARIIPLNAGDGGGRIIVIESPDGSFLTKYMHLSSVSVQAGDEISEGQTIGLMGASGFGQNRYPKYKAHLHYEIHKRDSNGNYNAINPMQNATTPIDPQQWVQQPLEEQYTFHSTLFVFGENSTESDSDSSSSSTNTSTSSTTSGGSRPAVTPLPSVTPAPINPVTPEPVVPTIIPGPPSPSPKPPPPIIIPPKPNCLDC
jgi:murein DD-endopeptidase MepM/ murein hydrolase activator NlpD